MNGAINIYQVFTRLFRNDKQANLPFGTIEENGCSKFEHFSPIALQALKEFGITHIWFTGINRHATCTSYEQYGLPANNSQIVKGRAGSPYAITDYYDVDPDLATEPQNRMLEFEALVERCHSSGLKVIIDFVPNHVARQYKSTNLPQGVMNLGENDNTNFAFLPTNNFYYEPNDTFRIPEGINLPYTNEASSYLEFPAKATGNDAFTAQPSINDWYETVKLNYGVDYLNNMQSHFDPIPDTWEKMVDIMKFWAQKGVDGLRCDMAELVPVEFWNWAIRQVKEENSRIIIIAEVYKPQEYKRFLAAGFDYLYDKVGLYDILRALIEGYGSARDITMLWQQYEGYSHKMLRFLENHDEQRITSPQFANNPWKALPAMILAATLNTGPLMVYFGQEIGEKATDSEGFSGYDGRTTIFDYWSVTEYQKWVNKGTFNSQLLSEEQNKLRNFYQKLNQLRIHSAAINAGSFYDLMWVNSHVNTNKIYAYIRHHGKEVVLVVLNFDLQNEHSIKLKFPIDAIRIAGLSTTKTWKATEVITQNFSTSFHPFEAEHEGIALQLKVSSGLVFRIS
jgi:glycosidase